MLMLSSHNLKIIQKGKAKYKWSKKRTKSLIKEIPILVKLKKRYFQDGDSRNKNNFVKSFCKVISTQRELINITNSHFHFTLFKSSQAKIYLLLKN